MKSFRLRSAIEATSSAKRWAEVRSQSSVLLISSSRLFWETILDEHNINRSKHFYGTNLFSVWTWTTRRVAQDLRATCGPIGSRVFYDQPNRCSCIGQLFNPASCSQLGSRPLPGGAELIDSVLDFTHYKAENCDCKDFKRCTRLEAAVPLTAVKACKPLESEDNERCNFCSSFQINYSLKWRVYEQFIHLPSPRPPFGARWMQNLRLCICQICCLNMARGEMIMDIATHWQAAAPNKAFWRFKLSVLHPRLC